MYKFRINGEEWTIDVIDKERLRTQKRVLCASVYKEFNEDAFYTGYSDLLQHNIVLNSYLCEEELANTLRHELTHCWLYAMGFNNDMYEEEEICDFMPALSKFINIVVNGFVETRKKELQEFQAQIRKENENENSQI